VLNMHMKKLMEAVQVTPAMEADILRNPHIQMGFEVEFIYLQPGISSESQVLTQRRNQVHLVWN